jgi:hypothetical protein
VSAIKMPIANAPVENGRILEPDEGGFRRNFDSHEVIVRAYPLA